jgi:succinate-semialdehyde dehydrogenase/glutarate-semialdehyde dehydrogenase
MTSNILKTQAFINGAWLDSAARFPVHNPATGELLAEVADCGASETQHAIAAAEAALPQWRGMVAKERTAILRRWYELILQHADALAELLTREQGKPLAEAKGEITYGANFVEFYAEEAKRIYGEVIPSHRADARIITLRQPLGVVAAITPWNFPLAMITRKIAPALAAGCTVIVKPAEETPLSALAVAVLAEQAGFPPGVINIIPTSQPALVGEALCASPVVRGLTFTGSTQIGKLLMAQAAATVKKVSLELGGNAPFIIFDDADPERAVADLMAAKFRNMGQTCVCANRVYVQAGIYEQIAERMAAAMRALQLGNGLQAGVTQGPLINQAALAKVQQHVADALQRGAICRLGGKPAAQGRTYFEPTLLTDVPPDALLTREETFGPVAALIRFQDEAEVIAAANASPYGLAGYFYSRDLGRVWRVAEALDCGIVGVNEGIISTELAPFGGMKQSGLGREGSHHGIEEFTEIKYVLMGGLGPAQP